MLRLEKTMLQQCLSSLFLTITINPLFLSKTCTSSTSMAAAFLLFLLLCSAIPPISKAKDSKILVSSKLKPGTDSSLWLSESGIFAFGFYRTPKGYAVCVFLAGIPEKTVVWTANKFDPVLPNNVVSLTIEEQGLLIWHVTSDFGYGIYDRIAAPAGTAASAAMLDSGNFVLYNSGGGAIWQSFDYPTHALLPGQRVLSGQELVSRASRTDLAIGKFRLKMQSDGNLVQYPVSTSDTGENAYYASGTYEAGANLSLDNDGRLYLYGGGESWYDLTSGGGGGGGIYLARIDPDGIFRLYNRSLARVGAWMKVWRSTTERCWVKGICGANTFCTSLDDGSVDCTCLPGFGDGCREDFDAGDCRRSEKRRVRYEMRRVRNVTWIDNYYEVIDGSVSEDGCALACVEDCECVVAFFDEGSCRKQRLPLRYGVRSTAVSNTALVRVTLPSPSPGRIPAPGPAPPQLAQPPDGSAFGKGLLGFGKELPRSKEGISQLWKYIVIGVLIGVAVVVISSIIISYLKWRRAFCSRDEESKQNVNKLLVNHGSLAPKRYSYREIKKITRSFTEKLGQGGYGVVYKGKLPDGELVAVKVLKETHDNAEEFVNEVTSISRTSHVNIVNLLGFCSERKKRALVYEFMPNKSLDKFMYKAERTLEWDKLYEIAVGVARGLEYLHRGCNMRIIHFDIKPQNILLDKDLRPKISDFGLAKLCGRTQSVSVVSMLGTRGTIGYIAPEVFSRNFGVVSHKSDVYSYGIMLLQMAEARVCAEIGSFQSSDAHFLETIYEHVLVRNEKMHALVKEEEEGVVRKMLMVGFWCIQTAPSDRPSMNKVVDMLEGSVESMHIPPLPFLLSNSPKPELSFLQLRVIAETQSSIKVSFLA